MKNFHLLRKLLFCLPPETAHHIALKSLMYFYPSKEIPETSPIRIMGIDFPNKLGIAAGLDKNGEYIDGLSKLGVGHIEIGTITPKPQAGHKKPRLFRLTEYDSILNRMGFNNKGVDYLVNQVKLSNYKGVLGINIGKNAITSIENAIDDYLICLEKVYPYATYITVNISSPNTTGLRDLQAIEQLSEFIHSIKSKQTELANQHDCYKPIAIKVAPDLTDKEIQQMAELFLEHKVDGIICTNTTINYDNVALSKYIHKGGGVSGAALTESSLTITKKFANHLQGNIPIIGVGGIMTADDAKERLTAGADILQLYTGFIYNGPELIKEIIATT